MIDNPEYITTQCGTCGKEIRMREKLFEKLSRDNKNGKIYCGGGKCSPRVNGTFRIGNGKRNSKEDNIKKSKKDLQCSWCEKTAIYLSGPSTKAIKRACEDHENDIRIFMSKNCMHWADKTAFYFSDNS